MYLCYLKNPCLLIVTKHSKQICEFFFGFCSNSQNSKLTIPNILIKGIFSFPAMQWMFRDVLKPHIFYIFYPLKSTSRWSVRWNIFFFLSNWSFPFVGIFCIEIYHGECETITSSPPPFFLLCLSINPSKILRAYGL